MIRLQKYIFIMHFDDEYQWSLVEFYDCSTIRLQLSQKWSFWTSHSGNSW